MVRQLGDNWIIETAGQSEIVGRSNRRIQSNNIDGACDGWANRKKK
jgi:hypothetical protein